MEAMDAPDEQQPAIDTIRTTGLNLGGAPRENRNRLRHGLFTTRLPPGMSYVTKRVNEYRKCLEQAVMDRYGAVDVCHAGYIQTACTAVSHAAKAAHWLHTAYDELDWSQRAAFSRETVNALAQRDKAVALLGIEAKARPSFEMPAIPTFAKP